MDGVGLGKSQKLSNDYQKEDTNTVLKYLNSGSEYRYINLDSSLCFLRQAFYISQKLNYEKGSSISLYLYASALSTKGEHKNAIKIYDLALQRFEKSGNFAGQADVYSGIGNVYYFQQDYLTALEMHYKALRIYERINSDQGKSLCFQNIGNIFYQTDDDDEALLNYKKMYYFAFKSNFKFGIADALMNIGNIYFYKNDYKTALSYYIKSYNWFVQLKKEIRAIYALSNIANIYRLQKEYPKAINLYFDLHEKLEKANDIKGLVNIKVLIAKILIEQKKYDQAIIYLKSALQISAQLNDNEIRSGAAEALSKSYATLGRFKEAYDFQIEYDSIYKVFFNEQKTRAIKELSIKHEVENKNKKIQLLSYEKELQDNNLRLNKFLLIIVTLSLVIMLVVSFSIFKLYNLKTKTSQILESQKDIIQAQKNEIEVEKTKSDNVLLKILNIESNSELAEKESKNLTLEHYELFSDMYFKLKKDNIQAQYEAIKNQVNPHFLFNSLNVLSNLVHIDQLLAEQFIDQLAKVYRYVLEQKSNELVFIKTEIDFVNSYFFLLKIRFEDKIMLNIDLKEEILNYHTIPLALQILLENAFKHNTYSTSNRLIIDIYSEDDQYLVVRNTLQPKEVLSEQSTKIGQTNIINRYKFISQKPVRFLWDDKYYYAKIPIVKI